MEDGGVVGDVALEELYLGHGDELLLDEALVEAAYPRPLSPGPRLLRPRLFVLQECLFFLFFKNNLILGIQ